MEMEIMNDATTESPLLTVRETAQFLNIGKRTLWRWSNCGRMPKPIKLTDRCVRYRRSDLQQWIDAGCPDLREDTS